MKKENWEKELKENIFEYDGMWHKKGKNGECEKFMISDLHKLLEDQRHSLIQEIIEKVLPKEITYPDYHKRSDWDTWNKCIKETIKRVEKCDLTETS
jgi:hypothetical protein